MIIERPWCYNYSLCWPLSLFVYISLLALSSFHLSCFTFLHSLNLFPPFPSSRPSKSSSSLFIIFSPLFLTSFISQSSFLFSFAFSRSFLYFPFWSILTATLSSILYCHFVLSLCSFFLVLTFHFFYPFFSLQSYALGPFSHHSWTA